MSRFGGNSCQRNNYESRGEPRGFGGNDDHFNSGERGRRFNGNSGGGGYRSSEGFGNSYNRSSYDRPNQQHGEFSDQQDFNKSHGFPNFRGRAIRTAAVRPRPLNNDFEREGVKTVDNWGDVSQEKQKNEVGLDCSNKGDDGVNSLSIVSSNNKKNEEEAFSTTEKSWKHDDVQNTVDNASSITDYTTEQTLKDDNDLGSGTVNNSSTVPLAKNQPNNDELWEKPNAVEDRSIGSYVDKDSQLISPDVVANNTKISFNSNEPEKKEKLVPTEEKKETNKAKIEPVTNDVKLGVSQNSMSQETLNKFANVSAKFLDAFTELNNVLQSLRS